MNRHESGDALNYRFILPNKSVGELFRLLDYRNEKSEKSLESLESSESGESAESREQGEPLTRIHMFRKNIVFDLDGITFFSRLIDGE